MKRLKVWLCSVLEYVRRETSGWSPIRAILDHVVPIIFVLFVGCLVGLLIGAFKAISLWRFAGVVVCVSGALGFGMLTWVKRVKRGAGMRHPVEERAMELISQGVAFGKDGFFKDTDDVYAWGIAVGELIVKMEGEDGVDMVEFGYALERGDWEMVLKLGVGQLKNALARFRGKKG